MRVFVTGASGWIGSAVVPELIGAGHQVVGLGRSDESAHALQAAGAEVRRGSLDDLDTLRSVAGESDGVIHLAFKHDLVYSGDLSGASDADRLAIDAFGEALEGSDKPFLIASGTFGVALGRVATEEDMPDIGSLSGGQEVRMANAEATLALASRGIRSTVVRLPPTVHGEGDNGFMTFVIGADREKGISAYVGDGANRWPAVHRLDAARLFRLALESAPAGSVVHAVGDEGVPIRDIAAVIGRHLDVPVEGISPEEAEEHFSWLAAFITADGPASNALTQERLGWQPTHPGLIDDLDQGHYFANPT